MDMKDIFLKVYYDFRTLLRVQEGSSGRETVRGGLVTNVLLLATFISTGEMLDTGLKAPYEAKVTKVTKHISSGLPKKPPLFRLQTLKITIIITILTLPLVLSSVVVHEGIHVYQLYKEPTAEFTHFSINFNLKGVQTHFKILEPVNLFEWEVQAYTGQAVFIILMLILLWRKLE